MPKEDAAKKARLVKVRLGMPDHLVFPARPAMRGSLAHQALVRQVLRAQPANKACQAHQGWQVIQDILATVRWGPQVLRVCLVVQVKLEPQAWQVVQALQAWSLDRQDRPARTVNQANQA